jgi:hypothetical protein
MQREQSHTIRERRGAGPGRRALLRLAKAAPLGVDILWVALNALLREESATDHYPDFNSATLLCLPQNPPKPCETDKMLTTAPTPDRWQYPMRIAGFSPAPAASRGSSWQAHMYTGTNEGSYPNGRCLQMS